MDIQLNVFPYPIYLEHHHFSQLKKRLSQMSGKKFLLTDQNVATLYQEQIDQLGQLASFSYHIVPAGEASKSLACYQEVMNRMVEEKLTRSDCLIAFGGGVIGDLGGFLAATYLRGINFIQVPTTLLAMVDSAIGGKNGINFGAYKNQVGTFYHPAWVHIDIAYLDTLDIRQINNGLAEIIKYAILTDPALLEDIRRDKSQLNYLNLIKRSLEIKHAYVANDFHDQGKRQFLNLGHTFAHAIESISNHQVNHGEAVAIGLLWMARASFKLGWARQSFVPLLEDLYQKQGLFQTYYCDNQDLLNAINHDKKKQDQTIHLIIPVEIGNCVRQAIPIHELGQWIEAGSRL
ncbi:3-dehydroquinate synthase [Facklamia sp. P9177]|uniref:3-dehydroquinate synthase n=1 Tax=unclassified Facklamia TaxID=2622293 RepID=UPI003D16C47D